MDASQASALVSSAVISGNSWRLPGPGNSKIVLKSVDAHTASGGPQASITDLVGFEITIEYAPGGCDRLA